MLKVYHYYASVSIDGADWRKIDRAHTITDEEPSDMLIWDNVSFDEVRELLKQHSVIGMHNSHTLFRKKPTIEIRFEDAWLTPVEYKHFKTLSYKIEYKEWKDVPLQWLMEHSPADKVIQYLKERGINTCPMNF